MCVPWILRSLTVPLFNIGGNNVVEPSAPIIPCNKNDSARPQPAIHDGLNLLRRPLRTECDVLRRMFAIGGITVPIDPGNRGELAGRSLVGKQIASVVPGKCGQFANVVKGVTTVVAPGESRFLQCQRE